MKTEMTISRKTFKGQDGKTHNYTAYEIKIGENTFSMLPRAEDKKLLNYILEQSDFISEAE